MRPESLEEYAGVLIRRAFPILLVAVLVGGSVVAVGIRLPRVYSATVLIDVESKQSTPAALLPNLVQTALGGADPVMMQTLVSRLSTWTLLERVRREFADAEPVGARQLPPIPHLLGRIRPAAETGSRLIRLSVELRESEGGARNAALLANQLVETFRHQIAEEEQEDRLKETETQLRLIEDKQKELESQLDQMRGALVAFAREQGNPTLWNADLAQLLARQEALLKERRDAAFRRDAARAAQQLANDALDRAPDFVLSGRTETEAPLRRKMEEELFSLQSEAVRKEAEGLGVDAPMRRGIEAAQKFVERRLQNAPDRAITQSYGPNPRRALLQTRAFESSLTIAQTADELAELDRLLSKISEEIRRRSATIPEQEVRLEALQRQSESLAKVYEALLLRKSQVELALGETRMRETEPGRRIGGVAIVDPARPQLRPTRPRIGLLGAAGAVLGILVGLTIGLLIEWRETSGERVV